MSDRADILILPCPPCGALVMVIYVPPTSGDGLDPPEPARWDFLVPPSAYSCVVPDELMLPAIEAELKRPPAPGPPLADLPL